jgi:hypothetical protein
VPVDATGWLWRLHDSDIHLLRPLASQAFDPTVAVAVAQAISGGLPPRSPLVILEDSPGHAATRMAEAIGVSEYLAAHAARLAVLQAEGHVVLGLLDGPWPQRRVLRQRAAGRDAGRACRRAHRGHGAPMRSPA